MDERTPPGRTGHGPTVVRAAACLLAVVCAQLLADGTLAPGAEAGWRLGAAVILAAAAVAGWLALTSEGRPVSGPLRVEPGPPWTARRLGLGAVGLVLAGLPALAAPGAPIPQLVRFGSALGRSGNELGMPGFALWVGGTVLVIAALAGSGRRQPGLVGEGRGGRGVLIALVAVLLVAAVLRCARLAELPPEMISDHVEKLLDVREILAGRRPVFLAANGGREPLQAYLAAGLVRAGLPLGFLTLKLGMALVGLLTVPAVFLLGREVGGSRLGLLAAAVTAVCPWHLQLTRLGLRAPLAPLFSALALAGLLGALRTGRRNDWLMLGGLVGLGLYGYSAFRPMLLAAPLVATGVWWMAGGARWARPGAGRSLAGHLAAAAAVTTLVAMPLLRCAVLQSGDFWQRSLARVAGSEQEIGEPLRSRFADNWIRTIGMFNLTSDRTWALSAPGRPALDPVSGGLLLVGLASAFVAAARRDWRKAALLASIPVMLSATAMALAFPEEVPHLARASGALPAVAILVALPLDRLLASPDRRRALAWVVVALLLAGMAAGSLRRVFVEYRAGYIAACQPVSLGAEVARDFIARGGDLRHVWLVGWPHGWDYRALAIELGEPGWSNVLWGQGFEMRGAVEEAAAHVADPSTKLYLLGGPRAATDARLLEALYPGSKSTRHPGRAPRQLFWGVEVPDRH